MQNVSVYIRWWIQLWYVFEGTYRHIEPFLYEFVDFEFKCFRNWQKSIILLNIIIKHKYLTTTKLLFASLLFWVIICTIFVYYWITREKIILPKKKNWFCTTTYRSIYNTSRPFIDDWHAPQSLLYKSRSQSPLLYHSSEVRLSEVREREYNCSYIVDKIYNIHSPSTIKTINLDEFS